MLPKVPDQHFRPLNSRQARFRGVVLVILGLFLVTVAAAVIALLLDLIPLSSIFPGTYRDPNAQVEVSMAVWIFTGFLGLFGLLCVAEGGWQIWFGRRNKVLMILLIAMFLIFVGAGVVAKALR
jgi:MFS family permease